jgi:hypothetical protein
MAHEVQKKLALTRLTTHFNSQGHVCENTPSFIGEPPQSSAPILNCSARAAPFGRAPARRVA